MDGGMSGRMMDGCYVMCRAMHPSLMYTTNLDGGDIDVDDLRGVGPVVQQPPTHAVKRNEPGQVVRNRSTKQDR